MAQIHVMTGVERRRRWSEEQKQALVAAAFALGAVVSEVARRADLYPGQLYRWRRDLQGSTSGFAEVVVSSVAALPAEMTQPIEVMLGDGAQLHIPASASPDLAAAVYPTSDRREAGHCRRTGHTAEGSGRAIRCQAARAQDAV